MPKDIKDPAETSRKERRVKGHRGVKAGFEGKTLDEIADVLIPAGPLLSISWQTGFSDRIQDLISNGESEFVEFKRSLPPDDIIAADLAGFANSEGGILLLGVSDFGEIIGLSEGERSEAVNRLKKICDSLLGWPIDIGAIDVQGKRLVYARVDPAPKHLSPIMTSAGQIYVRRGAQLRRLEREAKQDLLRGSSGPTPKPADKEYLVFIAMSFRDEEEPALVDYFKAIERAIRRTELPLLPLRIDLVEGDYEISQRLMDAIAEADIVLVDFTLSPSNVYFELGYARGLKKRIIQVARKGTILEFDVRNWRTEFYRNATELEEKLIPALQAAFTDVAKLGLSASKA